MREGKQGSDEQPRSLEDFVCAQAEAHVVLENPGVPREAHPLRVGRCASDLWLWIRWVLCIVQWSVVTLHVGLWSVVALRDGMLVFMPMVVLRLHFVFKM